MWDTIPNGSIPSGMGPSEFDPRHETLKSLRGAFSSLGHLIVGGLLYDLPAPGASQTLDIWEAGRRIRVHLHVFDIAWRNLP
jgi:hypothetical protein